MKHIGVHGCRIVKPACRPGVFAVVATALAAVIAALVGDECVFVGGSAPWNIRIHIPHLAVGFFTGGLK